ncbi:MAG TPA: hypothetical protein VJX94_13665 [Stellaceae bacterium]|nr:hypothetical protein [Stellaceae bacterium]
MRRVSILAERHGPAPLDLDYRVLKQCAEKAEFVASALRWVEWARWSGRQQALLRMGGLLGGLALPLAGLEPFWPFLGLAPLGACRQGCNDGARRPAGRRGMTEPASYPRCILLAVTGLSPQIVTETLYALAVTGSPAWAPTEIRIITTRRGAGEAQYPCYHRHMFDTHPR